MANKYTVSKGSHSCKLSALSNSYREQARFAHPLPHLYTNVLHIAAQIRGYISIKSCISSYRTYAHAVNEKERVVQATSSILPAQPSIPKKACASMIVEVSL